MVVTKGKSHQRSFQESSIRSPLPSTSPFHRLEEVDQHQIEVFSLELPSLACTARSGTVPAARLTHPRNGGRKAAVFLPFLTATVESPSLHHYSYHSAGDEGPAEPELYRSRSIRSSREQTQGMTSQLPAPLLRLHPEMTQIATKSSATVAELSSSGKEKKSYPTSSLFLLAQSQGLTLEGSTT